MERMTNIIGFVLRLLATAFFPDFPDFGVT